MTIQKLGVKREELQENDLIWAPEIGWTETNPEEENLINEPIFNMAVYNAGDGPGYYSAEINVKGKVIYGYTWNVRKNNEGAGDYRLTFSLDEECGDANLNTFFSDEFGNPVTQLLMSVEEEDEVEITTESDDGSGEGGVAAIDYANNLTYIDIRILDGKGSGGNGGDNGNH